jgi:hypothetical protein
MNCRAGRRAFGEQSSAVPREMIVPALLSRVKQRDDVTGLRVDSGKIRSLVAIAVTTGEGQIFWHAWTTMLERNDVIEMERQLGEGFREAAIFASVPSPGTDGFVNRLSTY